MAMSPPEGRGKDRTSVGLFLRRKRRLSWRRHALPAIRTSTSPWTLAKACAWRTKRWICAGVTPGVEAAEIAFSKMTILRVLKLGCEKNLAALKTKREGQPPSRQEFY